MSKRKLDFVEVRTKVRKIQEYLAGLAPLLEEEEDSENDSESSISSSVVAFRTLSNTRDKEPDKEDGGNKENHDENRQASESNQKDPEILNILGIDADENKSDTAVIDADLLRIWHKLVNKGLTKAEKDQLLENYKRIPEFEAKKLNAEISTSLASKNAKKDTYMADLQNIVGSSLMAIGSALTLLISEEECDKLLLLKKLSDVARLNIAAHHAISITRKANIFIPDLTPQVAELIKKAEMDETLYGNNLGERIKESKALSKLSQDIKQKPSTSGVRKPFLLKGPQQKRPFSVQVGNYQGKSQSKTQSYKTRQHYFNDKAQTSRSSSSTSQRTK